MSEEPFSNIRHMSCWIWSLNQILKGEKHACVEKKNKQKEVVLYCELTECKIATCDVLVKLDSYFNFKNKVITNTNSRSKKMSTNRRAAASHIAPI